ncbi:MAG: hypothetical protein WCL02_01655 [bacterium]
MDINKYITKVIEQQKIITQNKLVRLLIKYPGIEEKNAVVAKAYGMPLEEKDVSLVIQESEIKKKEKKEKKEDISNTLINELDEILATDTLDEQKISQIEKKYLSLFGLKKIVWK